ncbi:hypothetical protein FJR48_12040 (plasmid) [Sulfurimonas lithotrophica]|uniref:Globin domain-containing protein n=1 Tax=Sulfurimonas lithotrophica TaxID=2590022 RepID=A0A5P8P4I5_9BACT|nr:globin domain-containing protein [Sulfurimonas lithotrophica]QFR50527.1 hypothetical protein FJR48_12040 [Sulfurimonas lithotrophica]
MKLSQKTIDTVKRIANPVSVNAESIAKRMYEILFEKHPEMEKLFDEAGANHHKKLALAVIAFVDYIDDLDVLENTLEKIAVEHVKKNIKPEHYPLIEKSILKAIKDVLGDVATNEVIDAWREAFSFLSQVLIEKEKKYKAWYL